MSKPKPTDPVLYEKIKQKLYEEMPKHSAYRSGQLVQRYKKAFKKKYKDKEPYTGKKEDSNLKRWFEEDWRTQEGSTTYKKKGDVFRPTKRISKKTPTTFSELTKSQIKKAQKEKKKKGRVKKFDI